MVAVSMLLHGGAVITSKSSTTDITEFVISNDEKPAIPFDNTDADCQPENAGKGGL